MTVIHELCAYDRTTELVAAEVRIPPVLLPVVRGLVGPRPDDPALVLAYDIAPENVLRLAAMLGVPVDVDKYVYTVEASAVEDEPLATVSADAQAATL